MTDANELVAQIHNRMPLILTPGDYAPWLSDEPDPRDLLRPFPAEPMRLTTRHCASYRSLQWLRFITGHLPPTGQKIPSNTPRAAGAETAPR